jgi:hypothetical protein
LVQFGVDQLSKAPSCYCCPNCKSSNGFKIQRHRIDDTHSIQLKSCNNCRFSWKEIWSSYSQSIWSLQYGQYNYHRRQKLNPITYKIS